MLHEGVLCGRYTLTGEHHGRPMYRLDIDRGRKCAYDVHLYYWDEAAPLGGWWFGCKPGYDEVFAWHPSSSIAPPKRGWACGSDFDGHVELLVKTRLRRQPESGAARRPRSRSPRRCQSPTSQQPMRRTDDGIRGPRSAPEAYDGMVNNGSRVELVGRGLSDWDLDMMLKHESKLAHRFGIPGIIECMDFSRNDLTDSGVRILVNWVLEHQTCVKRLKLFRNKLESPDALCELVDDKTVGAGPMDGLVELHLSNCGIKLSFLKALLRCVGRARPSQARPRRPFWLRVEHNPGFSVKALERLEQELRDEQEDVSICLDLIKPKGSHSCSLHKCAKGAQIHAFINS